MRMKTLALPIVAAGAALLLLATGTSAKAPVTSVLASGVSTTGAAIGPDGALYAGLGGTAEPADEKLTLPADLAEAFGIESVWFGLHSTIVRVDPDTGDVTTHADGLPSASDEFGGEAFISPADVIWVGDTLYVLITGGAPAVGGPAADWPNGIYRHEDDGSWSLVADINKFNDDNPVAFPDAGPGGNPFAIDVRDGEFIVSDGNYNRLLRITMDGDIDILVSFDNIVPTGLAASGPGPILNTWFSAAPHVPGDSFLVSVPPLSGDYSKVAGGYAQLIDVEFGPGGKTYVLQFGDQSLDEAAPPPPGRLLVLEDGELHPIVEGLMLATSVNFSGDTAYITSLTGDVVAVEDVSTLEPIVQPAPQPTVAPAPKPASPGGTITPPNTGSGPTGDDGSTPLWLLAALSAAGVACLGAGAVATKR